MSPMHTIDQLATTLKTESDVSKTKTQDFSITSSSAEVNKTETKSLHTSSNSDKVNVNEMEAQSVQTASSSVEVNQTWYEAWFSFLVSPFTMKTSSTTLNQPQPSTDSHIPISSDTKTTNNQEASNASKPKHTSETTQKQPQPSAETPTNKPITHTPNIGDSFDASQLPNDDFVPSKSTRRHFSAKIRLAICWASI